MAKHEIYLKKTSSIVDEIERLHDEISRRAYDLFLSSDRPAADPLADWLRAERDLIQRPAIALRETDGMIELDVALPGVDPKDVNVQVAPEDILVRASTRRQHEDTKGTVHTCEFERGQMFRSVRLPRPIDADSVKTEYHNGMLHLKANVARGRKAETKAA